MLGVTRLITGAITPGDVMRYGQRDTRKSPAHMLHYSQDKRPVVVWNIIRRCNLHCVHCYSDSHDRDYEGELTHEEALDVIDQLAEYEIPTVLFSGGEPLLRPDIFELADYARDQGIRCVLSTNGVLIDDETADKIKDRGFAYVGISIDGIGEVHDKFRGKEGAFEASLEGIRRCRERDIRVGMRFTINGMNYDQLDAVLDLLETRDVPRCCVYHLAYAGRGDRISGHDLTHEQARTAVLKIFDKALYFKEKGMTKDILTVDNHTDNVLLYKWVQEHQPERADEVYQMLKWNGGNQSGVAVCSIDWHGNVHVDQFSQHYSVGNVRETRFADIWENPTDPVLAALKDRKSHLKGRCGLCQYVEICNGNLRVRAESATGDMWAPDPACYLTDEEIGLTPEQSQMLAREAEQWAKAEVPEIVTRTDDAPSISV